MAELLTNIDSWVLEQILDELNISEMSPEDLCIALEDMLEDTEYTRTEILLYLTDYLTRNTP